MSTPTSVKTSLQESLEKLQSQIETRSQFSQKAWKSFLDKGLPTVKEEAFQYFKLGGLYNLSLGQLKLTRPDENWIQEVLLPYQGKNTLVFYQGEFLPRYSSYEELEDDLVILPLTEAQNTYSTFIQNTLDRWIEKENDPFACLSLALSQDGLFVYVPKNTQVEQELFVIELSDLQEPSLLSPLSLFSLGAGAELNLTTVSLAKDTEKSLHLNYFGFYLDSGAKLQHTHGTLESNASQLTSFRVHQKACSTYKQVEVILDPFKARSSTHVELNGEEAHAEMLSLAALKKKQEAHAHILVDHLAPHTTSRQLVKNLLDDESLSSFEGKIFVDPIAQKTNAYQLNANCILSDEAKANSKPNLEIFADDVKASHGSTTGQVSSEELFYLQSRGLSKDEASKMLLKGFCEEILEEVSSTVLQKIWLQNLEDYFKAS